MAAKVPAQGIQAYMDAQVAQLTPPNALWRIKQWFSTGPGVWIIIALIIIGLVAPGFGSAIKTFIYAAVAFVALPSAVFVVVLAIGPRDPGYWRRYSIAQLLARHPHLYGEVSWAPLAIRIHGRDSAVGPEPEAEFEAAVLEWRGKTYGLVLFQVLGHKAEPMSEVIQVCGADGMPVQFGEAYAVPAT